jgi:hypothetical protein
VYIPFLLSFNISNKEAIEKFEENKTIDEIIYLCGAIFTHYYLISIEKFINIFRNL